MKVIFLACDGVLNTQYSQSRCGLYIGADADKLKRLKRLVDTTGAEIILTSKWRLNRTKRNDDSDTEGLYDYLVRKLKRYGMRIIGQTTDMGGECMNRGHEIMDWLEKNNDIVDGWVVIDSDWYEDYSVKDIKDYIVMTETFGENAGLQDHDVDKAIEILTRE